MTEFFGESGWRVLVYPIEIGVNGFILFFVLNRLVPPSHDITFTEATADTQGGAISKMRKAYPLWRCLTLSLCLFALFSVASGCLALPRPLDYPGFGFLYLLLAIAISYFGSTYVIGKLFRMPRGQIIIFILYVLSSIAVEKLWSLVFPV